MLTEMDGLAQTVTGVTDRDVQSKRQKFKTFRRNEKGLIYQMTRFDKFRVFSSQQMHFQHLSRNNTSIKRVGKVLAKQCPEFFEEGMRTRDDQ